MGLLPKQRLSVSGGQVVKDRISLRAVEKVIDRLVNSKEQAEQRTETALQPLDINADGTYNAFQRPDVPVACV